jgi:GNAT superfamily N-acetyltransferase
MDYRIRKATLDDREAIQQLIADSARGLSRADYSDEQIETALSGVFGVDTALIIDGTYFVAESGDRLAACGGWSRRKTLYGGDKYGGRDSSTLDPRTEPAKIRAFFVHPDFARKGIGRAMLSVCEGEAKAAGFHALELMSTLPGLPLYRACGYEGDEQIDLELSQGIKLGLVPMKKMLD